MAGREDARVAEALREAVRVALLGDWQAAHLVAQEHEGHPLADWLHAVVHRMEGDLGNARYWYGRCRRPPRDHEPFEAELGEIEAALSRPGPKASPS